MQVKTFADFQITNKYIGYNIMRIWPFDWSDCVIKNLVDRCLQCGSDSNAVYRNDDSRTLHVLTFNNQVLWVVCMPVLLYSSLELQFMFGFYKFVYLIILTAMSQIYNSWIPHDSNSTRTGACITQNQMDWRSHKLNHIHGHSPDRYRPAKHLRFLRFLMF